MFQGHPKGLYVLFFSNMGERFGYYTMLAIFVYFLSDHFGWNEAHATHIYGIFLAGIYFMPLFGGLLADKVLGYGKTIMLGLFFMMLGYALLAMPSSNPYFVYGALATICVGVGFFKGNLSVILGNLYNKTVELKDAAFNIFYMGINIGAFFAPYAAEGMKSFFLRQQGFEYHPGIPQLAHDFMNGVAKDYTLLHEVANNYSMTDTMQFCKTYLSTLAHGYNAAFAIAGVAMLLSLGIFLVFRKHYVEGDYSTSKDKKMAASDIQLTPEQTKDRVIALLAIFGIVVFFWMAFHQNGAALSFFAKSYTKLSVSKFTYLFFNLPTLLSIIAVLLGLLALWRGTKIVRVLGAIFALAGAGIITWKYLSFPETIQISPELFQTFNPIFIVFMTPIIVGFFTYLGKKKKEPSSPAKIGIGMFITAIGFSIMLVASLGLPPVSALKGTQVSPSLVSPYWLISIYFVLTIAELFLSPMGLSFVSKVSPPNMRGLMQGGWLASTAIGNYLAGYVGRFYQNWELWQFFLLLVTTSLLAAFLVAIVLKKINKAISS